MSFDLQILKAAHKHSACHRKEVLASTECGCFHCESVFLSSSITEWIEETGGNYEGAADPLTALCPECDIDSVIGDSAPFPATDPQFLRAMNREWFGAEEAA